MPNLCGPARLRLPHRLRLLGRGPARTDLGAPDQRQLPLVPGLHVHHPPHRFAGVLGSQLRVDGGPARGLGPAPRPVRREQLPDQLSEVRATPGARRRTSSRVRWGACPTTCSRSGDSRTASPWWAFLELLSDCPLRTAMQEAFVEEMWASTSPTHASEARSNLIPCVASLPMHLPSLQEHHPIFMQFDARVRSARGFRGFANQMVCHFKIPTGGIRHLRGARRSPSAVQDDRSARRPKRRSARSASVAAAHPRA